jgi:hypothetical protein
MTRHLWILAAAAALLAGCSNADELSTADQARKFIVHIARGGELAGWRLAGGASGDAVRVWAERATLQDLGRRLRPKAQWVCDFAEDSGVLGRGGPFNVNDRSTVTEVAKSKGARQPEIDALLSDVLKLANQDLVTAWRAVCG